MEFTIAENCLTAEKYICWKLIEAKVKNKKQVICYYTM